MKPDSRFTNLPKSFWAHVRTISQQVGYTERSVRRREPEKRSGRIRVPSLNEMAEAMEALGLRVDHIVDDGRPTALGRKLQAYFQYRAQMLNSFVEPRLMDAQLAKEVFHEHRDRLCPTCPLPMNKQKGEKKAEAFFTGVINMLIQAGVGDLPCDFSPGELTTVTRDGIPLRTLARRIDGAFPGPVNPVAVWEIKEYYYTTTFGSRVADGVYETLLDGMELEELREHEDVDVKHYLMIDDHFTWWDCGRSYLCRIIDMLHMGYVDEVLFGREVLERLPALVREWVRILRRRERRPV